VIQIVLPPLRDRREDLARLARRLLAFHARNNHRPRLEFAEEALRELVRHDWPGNIRELSNAVERAAILCRTELIGPEWFAADKSSAGGTPNIDDSASLEKIEERHIRKVLAGAKSLQDAADILGIDQATLWRRRRGSRTVFFSLSRHCILQ